jgi:hypothetical protein
MALGVMLRPMSNARDPTRSNYVPAGSITSNLVDLGTMETRPGSLPVGFLDTPRMNCPSHDGECCRCVRFGGTVTLTDGLDSDGCDVCCDYVRRAKSGLWQCEEIAIAPFQACSSWEKPSDVSLAGYVSSPADSRSAAAVICAGSM